MLCLVMVVVTNYLGNKFLGFIESWPDKPALCVGDGHKLCDVWSNSIVAQLLSVSPGMIRCYQNGESHTNHFGYRVNRWGQYIPFVDLSKVYHLMKSNTTFVIEEARTISPLIDSVALQIESALSESVWSNVFISSGSNGICPHWDDNDVIVFQVSGERKWYSSPPKILNPISISPRRSNYTLENPLEFYVRPGDVVVMPRGWLHWTKQATENSVHVMYAFRKKTNWDFVRWVLDTIATDEEILRENVDLLSEQKMGKIVELFENSMTAEVFSKFIEDAKKPEFQGVKRVIELLDRE